LARPQGHRFLGRAADAYLCPLHLGWPDPDSGVLRFHMPLISGTGRSG
jgi:hypothetical protein